MILDASPIPDKNKSSIYPSDKNECEHKFRFSQRRFEATTVSYSCVNEEFLDACKNLDVTLIGTIFECPSKKNMLVGI
jgi:hypothetical protein